MADLPQLPDFSSLADLRAAGFHRVAFTCGVFDGLHAGHQEILRHLVALAREQDAAPVLLTFEPHPEVVLNPSTAPQRLISHRQKLWLLSQLGIEAAVHLPFDRGFAQTPAETFLDQVIVHSDLDVTAICIGSHWRFGHKARGDLALLREMGERHGVVVEGIPELEIGARPVSSTRIREAIERGDLAEGARLLGRPFCLFGEVVHGKGIGGRVLHYPTANLHLESEVLPPCGIYAARAYRVESLTEPPGEPLPGVLYLGRAPTVAAGPEPPPIVPELFLLEFDGDLYGSCLSIEFLEFIRGDRKFESFDALRAQIDRDVEQAEGILEATDHRCPD